MYGTPQVSRIYILDQLPTFFEMIFMYIISYYHAR